MPVYGTKTLPTAIYPGDESTVWSAESPATGAASERVALGGAEPAHGSQAGISVELHFSADPGTFEVDVEVADTDVDAAYFTPATGAAISAVNAGFYANLQISPLQGKFARLIMKDDPSNSVTTTATIGR